LGGTSEKLRSVGVETLAVTEDRLDPIRRYFRVRPPRVLLATDVERNVHRAYGCPMPPYTGDYKQLWAIRLASVKTTRINPTGEAPEPIPEDQAVIDQFPPRDFEIHAGHFLIDQAGVVRWVQIETPIDDLSRYGLFPTDEELLAAARESLGARR